MNKFPGLLVCLLLTFSILIHGQDRHVPQSGHHSIVPLMRDGKPTSRGRTGYEIVSGNPEAVGEPFVIRIHNYDNQILPPHWHPGDEHIVVVKGTWYLGEGDKWDLPSLRELNVGDYVFVPANMRHFGISKGETVVQIHGRGPFKINLADPWAYLPDPKAAKNFKYKENQGVRSKRGQGIIRWGIHSARNQITQYAVEEKNGNVFFEFENELELINPT